MKLRIGIDMDGVIADLLSKWVDIYNQEFNDNLKPEQITLWNWHPLTKDKKGEKLYTYLDDPELFRNLPVIEGSQEVLNKYNDVFDFWIVTAAFNPINIPAKVYWLRENFPFLDVEKFMFVRNKSGFKGDLLIDDKPKNIDSVEGKGILFTAPHNKKETKYVRADNWNDLDVYFERLLFWRKYDERKSKGTYPRSAVNLLH
jgi:5'(3')-deoxyribonucleotidase